MDSDSIIMLLIMILLTALSSFFSATETAFSSFNRIRIKSLSSGGNKRAALVLKLDDKYDKLITTVLIGNNIVNITLTTIATLFFMHVLKNIGQDLAATISTIVITVVVLIFGEISPKTLAKEHADGYVLSTCGVIRGLVTIFTPLTALFSALRFLLSKIFKTNAVSITTEDDLITMVEEAEQDGGLDEDESELIRSAIEFSDRTAGEILTPRIDIVAIKEGTDPREIMMLFFESGYSRLPVVGDSVDDVKGVLHEKDFFLAYTTGKDDLRPYYQKPFYISKHYKVDELLRDLQSEKCHMAFVIDEFGGILGVVTMEDIIEELIGDVWDEHDEVETFTMIKNEDGSITMDCAAELDELLGYFDIRYEEDDEKPQTVNGWVQKQFEGLPEAGESFTYGNLLVTVTACDDKMVKEINAKLVPEEDEKDDRTPTQKSEKTR